MSHHMITIAHGAGGAVMQRLIKNYILKHFANKGFEVPLEALDDSGVVDGIAFTTDSYTVKPLFFPGGDIGRLAVAGTVNDLAVLGADPLALSSSFVVEEGFPIDQLEKILQSMASTCNEAGVGILTGDTKVVERGALDKMIINTSGIGRRSAHLGRNMQVVKEHRRNFNANWLLDSNIRKGDVIILSGTLGDHGTAIMSARGNYGFESGIKSDVAPLNHMIRKALEVGGVVSIKDPTRGGLANLLNEWSEKSHVGILIRENSVPVRESVRATLGFLGLDAMEVGNEGKVCIAVIPEKAEEVLRALRETREGRDAAVIGEATDEFDVVVLETLVGGKRIVAQPAGDPIPRIC
ncbi:MAG: hydrogenase expression/formation protein HypE [Nitrososphaerales archaeon]